MAVRRTAEAAVASSAVLCGGIGIAWSFPAVWNVALAVALGTAMVGGTWWLLREPKG